jgi:hypothetical protein
VVWARVQRKRRRIDGESARSSEPLGGVFERNCRTALSRVEASDMMGLTFDVTSLF